MIDSKQNKSIVPETYESLRDYMQQNNYPAIAVLEDATDTITEELYGTNASNVNSVLNIYTN